MNNNKVHEEVSTSFSTFSLSHEELVKADNAKQSIKSLFTDFATSTSAHGLQNVASSKSKIEKAAWLLVCIAALSMFSYMLASLVQHYHNRPVSTSIKIGQEKMMKFPSVMICNHNMLRKSALDTKTRSKIMENTQNKEIYEFYRDSLATSILGHDAGSAPQSVGEQGTNNAQVKGKNGSHENGGSQKSAEQNSNVTIDVMNVAVDSDYVTMMTSLENIDNMNRSDMVRIGHNFTSFVSYCNWKGMQCHKGELKKYWYHHWNYLYGNCYIFNYGRLQNGTKMKPLYMTNVGADNALTLELNIEQDEYLDHSNIEAGVRVLLSDQEIFVFPVEEGFSVAPGVSASIGLNRIEVTRADPFKNGTCRKEPIGEENLHYTIQRCSHLCRLKQQANDCNCTDLKYCSPHRTCTTAKEKLCSAKVEEKYRTGLFNCDAVCPQPCRETSYKHATTSSNIFTLGYQALVKKRFNLNVSDTYIKQNYIRLQTFYEDQNVEYIISKAYYGLDSLMSDIGGQLGLWIGVSAVTCVEILMFFYSVCKFLVQKIIR